MSMFDKESPYKTPCPDCGGEVYRDYFGGDCRGDPSVTTIWCKKCEREFTEEEWDKIEKAAEKKPKERAPAKQKDASINPGIELAIQMANDDLEKSGLKRVLEETGKTAKKKPKKRAADKKTGRKTERKSYSVHNANGTKCVWYRLSGEGGGSVSVDVIDGIIKAEFPRVPRKKIRFSVDNNTLYFGDDLD